MTVPLEPLVGHWPRRAQSVLPLRYTIHWGRPGDPSTVTVDPDPNPMPRFRIWRWWR